MIVSANTDNSKWALWGFLRAHGVDIPRSEDFRALGRLSPHTKDLIGVVGYNGFCGKTCQMHMAGDGNWVNREFLFAAFDYPFNQLKLNMVLGPVAGDNARALKLDAHLGFKEVARVKDGWDDGVDLIVLGLKREDCRWHNRRLDLRKAA